MGAVNEVSASARPSCQMVLSVARGVLSGVDADFKQWGNNYAFFIFSVSLGKKDQKGRSSFSQRVLGSLHLFPVNVIFQMIEEEHNAFQRLF